MPNQQLIEYIKQARAAGKSDAEIKSALLSAGWGVNDIEGLLNTAPKIFSDRLHYIIKQEVIIKNNILKKIIYGCFLLFWIFSFLLIEFLLVLKFPDHYSKELLLFNISSMMNVVFFAVFLHIIPRVRKWTTAIIHEKPIALICFFCFLIGIFIIMPAEIYYKFNTVGYEQSIFWIVLLLIKEYTLFIGLMISFSSILIASTILFAPLNFTWGSALSLRQHKRRWLLALLIPMIFPLPFVAEPVTAGFLPGFIFFLGAVLDSNIFIIFQFLATAILLYLLFIFLHVLKLFIQKNYTIDY